MPPSILSSEALVIWMFRMAMNAPIMAAITEIQTTALARSGAAGATATAMLRRTAVAGEVESARSDMASPFASSLTSLLRNEQRHAGLCDALRLTQRSLSLLLLRLNGRDHRHPRAKLDAGRIQRDLHGDALHHLGEIAGGVVGRQ